MSAPVTIDRMTLASLTRRAAKCFRRSSVESDSILYLSDSYFAEVAFYYGGVVLNP
jgi:hypothetical protein